MRPVARSPRRNEIVKEIKDTVRSQVRVGFDGRVHKIFRGTNARERFLNELRVLRYLEQRGCDFVPKVLEHDHQQLYLVTTNCGSPVTSMTPGKMESIFQELEEYGVRHGDAFLRNITYDPRQGRFCVIDFELAEIVDLADADPSFADPDA
jgi:tRNA A-37 threonylcarbamoyl transferase component Bud32